MSAAFTNLARHVRRRPGLAWVLTTTVLVAAVSIADVSPQARLPFIMVFFLTVPGFLILDLRYSTDVAAKVSMGIASSVSFYIVCVSIALLASASWLAPTAVIFLIGLIAWLFARRRQRQAVAQPAPGDDTNPAEAFDIHGTDQKND